MINRKFHKSILWILLAIAPSAAMAAKEEFLEMELEELLRVPVTGSTLSAESIKTVPAAVTVFTRDQIERMGFDYLFELLSLAPGYQITRGAESAYNYSFSARGRRSSGQAREILLVMDGRQLANPRSGAVDTTLPFIPLDQLERVEVIRGPGSAIYGSSAFNGVINVISRQSGTHISGEIGSDNSASLSGRLSGNTGNWAASVYGRVYRDDGQDYPVIDSFSKQPITTSDARETVDLDGSLINGDTQLRAAFHSTRGRDFYMQENTQNDFNGSHHVLQQISLDQQLHLVDEVNTHFYAGYLVGLQDLHLALVPAEVVTPISNPQGNVPLLSIGKIRAENINLRLTNDWTIDTNASALWGLEWKREEDVRSDAYNNYDLLQLLKRQFPIAYYGNFENSSPLSRGDTFEAAGIYGQYQRDVTTDTRLTLGARYDYHQYFGEHFTPRLGLVHQLSGVHTLKLLYGEAFRAPSLGETGIINNPLIVGNPDLDFELVRTWDLIWMANWPATNLSLGLFRNDYENPIVAGFIGTTRTFINSREEYSDGAELEVQQRITRNWSLRLSYTDFFTLPATAFREAEHLASLELNYNRERWNWNLLGWHQGERRTPGANGMRNGLDDFWVFNTKLRYQLSETVNTSLQFKNLADLDYSTPAQGLGLPHGVPNRERELSFKVEWSL